MMKQRITLFFLIFFNFLTLWGENDKPKLLEEVSDTAACTCNTDRDLAVLKELYDNNGGLNWFLDSGAGYQVLLDNNNNAGFSPVPNAGVVWDVNAPNANNSMGTWHGVKTNQEGCVTELILWSGGYSDPNQSVGLTGELPASLSQLCALETFMLPNNGLTGAIPAGLDALCNLEALFLHNNQLEGPLPPEIGDLANLKHLSLHNNAFTGGIPDTYTKLTELAIFNAENNKLTGPIPSDIGNLTKLFNLNLADNCLSGTVPPSIVTVGTNSIQNGFPLGGIQSLLLNNNKLDSLPDITTISLLNGAPVDVSGNHFTFDDIIPNINVITEYADQILDLDTTFCLTINDTNITLKPGFDESIDALSNGGDRSIYIWTREEDDFTDTSTINCFSYSAVTARSAGNHSISVTNRFAPDLTLKVVNFIVKVASPNSSGPLVVCPNTTTPYYVEDAESFDWTVSGGGTFLATGDSLYITWGQGLNSLVTATGKEDGCNRTTSFNITILPDFTVNINPPEKLNCNRASTTLKGTSSDSTTSFSWQDEQGNSLSTVDSLVVTTAGNYILIGQNENSCETRDTVVVEEEDAVITSLDLIQGEAGICDNAVSFLSVEPSFSSYRWSTSPTDTMSSVFIPLGVGTFSVTVTDANGCIAIDSIEVKAIPDPEIDLVQNGVLGCNNSNVTLSNTIANSGEIFQWKDATNAIIGTDTFISIDSTGIYSLTVRNSSGCTHTDTIEVLRDTTDYVVDAGDDQVLTCTAREVNLDASNSIDAVSYIWFDNDSIIGTSSGVNVTAVGTYRVEVTNDRGCTATDEVSVVDSAYALPPPILTGPPTFCEGTISGLNLSNTYSSYLWSTGDTLPAIFIDSAGLYSVTVSDAAGCTGSNGVSVIIKPTPTFNITGDKVICSGTPTTLEVDSTFNSYLWNTGSLTREVQVDTAGFYSVTVIGDNGCSAKDSVEVQDLNSPVINFVQTGTLDCNNAEVILSNDIVGTGQEFEWSDATGIIDNGIFIAVNNPGVYILTIRNEFGCTQSDSIEIVADTSLPVANAGSNQVLTCTNNQVVLDGSNSIDAVSYSWLDKDSVQVGTEPTLMVSQAGNYTLAVKNASGCMTTDEVVVVDSIFALRPEFVEDTFCEGANNSLSLRETYSQYQWSTGDTTPMTQVDTTGVYTINVVDQNGCTGSNSVSITIDPIPMVEFTGDTIICNGGIATIGVADSTFTTYVWSTGSALQTTTIDTAGFYVVTVTDANACSATVTTFIEEIPTFEVEVAGNRTVCEGVSTTLNAMSSNPNVSYEWSTGDSFFIVGIDNPGTYTLTVTDENACTIEDSIEITRYIPPITFSNTGTSLCTGGTADISVVELYPSYEWSTGDSTQSITITGEGSYVVTITDINGCQNNVSNIIVASSGPNLPNGVKDSICVGGTTILEAPTGFREYEWSTGEISPSIEVAAAGNYQVTVTDNGNCKANMNIRVREVSLSKPAILGSSLLCEGSSTELTTANDFATYQWSTGETTATISIEEMDIYSVTVSGESGCTAISEAFIIERAPNIDFDIIGNTAICAGASTMLQADNTYLKYAWSTGDTSATISVDEVGIYSLVVTNSAGCTGTAFLQVEERSTISPQITGQKVICENGITEISADSDYASYLWSTGDTTKSIIVDSIGLYSLHVTNTVGCEGSMTQLIKEDENVAPQIMGEETFCEGTSTTIGLADPYSNYLWSTGDTTATITIDTSTNLAVTVTNENGCVGQTIATIESQAIPQPIIIGDTIVCEGSSTVANPFVVDEFVSYKWDTGNVWDTLPRLFLPNAIGIHTVIVTDRNGCTGSASISISEVPTLEIEEVRSICEGGTIDLSLDGPYTNYQWYNGDTSAVVTVTMAGTYDLTVTDTTFGCKGTAKFIVNGQDVEDLVINYPTKCYEGTSIALSAANPKFSDIHNYRWLKDGIAIGNFPFFVIEEPGIYTLELEDTEIECVTSKEIEIFENDIQLRVGEPLRVLNCDNNIALIDVDDSTSANYFNWQRIDLDNPNITEKIENETDTLNAAIAGRYRLIGINTMSGCSDTTFVEVRDSIEPLQLSITGDKTICEGSSIEIEVSVEEPGNKNYQYNWSTNSDTTTAQIDVAGTYSVTVTGDNACIGVDSVEINNKEKVFLEAELTVANDDDLRICPGDSIQLTFAVLKNGFGPFEFTYMIGDSTDTKHFEDNKNEIWVTPEVDTTYYRLLEVVDEGNNCYEPDSVNTDSIAISFLEVPKAIEVTDVTCKNENTGVSSFNLKNLEGEVNGGNSNNVTWYVDTSAATDAIPLRELALYDVTETTNIYASVRSDDNQCESERVAITLEVQNCSTNLEMAHEAGLDLDLSNYTDEEETLEVYITNRWGDLVFLAKNYNIDNKFRGNDLPQGAYYIYMKRKSEGDDGIFVPYKGVIYLLK